ncbi:MAG: molybdate ABC transporter substrate-binding protein [Bacteroidetes bacterium]|nr:molybdate ABC transporter substrate-binding protein [Bacteroidota bacterium]
MSRVRYLIALASVTAVLLGACSQSAYEGSAGQVRKEMIVYAAASLKDAFTELGKEVEKQDSTVKVTFSFGASNLLERQIEQGAPADVFASAAMDVMDSAQAKGTLVEGTRRVFAGNSLVVIAPKGSTPIASLDAIADARYKHVAVASPGVPVRKYAEEALRKQGVWDRITDRMVFGENVRQVVDYVASGSADIGLVYSTDAQQFKGQVVTVLTVDQALYKPVTYPVAVIKSGRNRAGADTFMRVLASPRGTEILHNYGFPMPGH